MMTNPMIEALDELVALMRGESQDLAEAQAVKVGCLWRDHRDEWLAIVEKADAWGRTNDGIEKGVAG